MCVTVCIFFFFFFSSRRRHTRSLCDWSSDVCSSDLLRFIVPLYKSGRDLGETVDARRDVAVEAARDGGCTAGTGHQEHRLVDRKSTRLDSSHTVSSYGVFFLEKKK